MMFGSLALLSGIALFSTAVALPAAPSVTTTPYLPATSTPSVSSTPPGIFLVLVGNLQGNTTYTPPYVNAPVNSSIVFTFASKNHTVTESSFEDPCTANSLGVDSGFNHAVAPGEIVNGTFVVNVTSNDPRWFYCRQINHCPMGMVFAINPTEDQTFADFQARAKASASSSTLPPLSTPTPSNY